MSKPSLQEWCDLTNSGWVLEGLYIFQECKPESERLEFELTYFQAAVRQF